MAFQSSNAFLQAAGVPVESWFPDVQIANPNLVTKPPAKIGFQGVVEVTSIKVAGLPITALLALVPSQVNFPSTIIIDNGGTVEANASVMIELSSNGISIPIDANTSWQLPASTFKITYKPNATPPSASFTVTNTFDIGFFDNPNTTAKLMMNVTKSAKGAEVDASLDLKFPNGGLKLPASLSEIITLSNLGASMGVCFEPPGCMAGFTAKVDFKTGNLQAESFAVVLDLEGEVPVPLYVAMQVSGQLTPTLMANMFLPGFNLTLPTFIRKAITINDPGFTWCDKKHVPLPDGTFAMPGFSGKGFFKLYNIYEAHGSLSVVYKKSIKGAFEGGPISLANGLFSISGDGAGIIEKKGVSNSHIPKSNEGWKNRNAKATTLVASGGPVLNFNMSTETMPTLSMNGQAHLFDLSEQINADVTESGIQFQFQEHTLISTTSTFTLNASAGSFQVSGSLGFAPSSPIPLPSKLGSLLTSNQIQAGLTITESEVKCSISLSILGENITMHNTLTLNRVITTAEFIAQVCKFIEANAGAILRYLASNPMLWFDAIDKYIIKVANLAVTDALQCMQQLDVAASDLKNYVGQIQNYFQLTKYCGMDPWAEAMKSVYAESLGQVGVVLHAIGIDADDIASTLQSEGIDAKYAAEAFQNIPVSIKDAALAMKSGFPNVPVQQIGSLLGQAGYEASAVKSEFQSLGGDFASAANSFFHSIDPINWF